MQDYQARNDSELSFKRGEVIYLRSKPTTKMWSGKLANGPQGLFPSNFVYEPQRKRGGSALSQSDSRASPTPPPPTHLSAPPSPSFQPAPVPMQQPIPVQPQQYLIPLYPQPNFQAHPQPPFYPQLYPLQPQQQLPQQQSPQQLFPQAPFPMQQPQPVPPWGLRPLGPQFMPQLFRPDTPQQQHSTANNNNNNTCCICLEGQKDAVCIPCGT